MRIAELTTHVMHDGYRNLIFVVLGTDDGLTGIGEATLTNRAEAVLGYLHGHARPALIGRDPTMAGAIWRDLYLGDFIRGGMIACAGLSAVSQALLDLRGKALGVPAWQLLGGAVHDRVPVYANAWYTVEREPSAIAEQARGVLALGYRELKIDPFGPGSYELTHREETHSLAILGAVRDAVGPDVELYVEGHGRFAHGAGRPAGTRAGRRPGGLVRGADELGRSGRLARGPGRVAGADRRRRAFHDPARLSGRHRGPRGRHPPARRLLCGWPA